MAEMEELYTALRNADAAGDTEAATKLATYIQSLPAPSAKTGADAIPGQSVKAPPSDHDQYSNEEYEAPSKTKKFLKEVGRQVGLTARAGVTGVTGLSGMLTDAPFRLANSFGANAPVPSEEQQKMMTRLGLPEPKNATERVVQAATAGMAGAGSIAGPAAAIRSSQPLTMAGGVAEKLAASPGAQVASGASGAGAGQFAAEKGAGPVGQVLASVGGAVAPMAIPMGAAMAVRGALRGSDNNIPNIQRNIETFKAAGDSATVGQATEGNAARGLESTLAKIPGGAGVMANKAEQQSSNIGKVATELADKLAPNASAFEAGTAIENGLKGPGGFVSRFKEGQKALYDKLDKYLPGQTMMPASNTTKALASMNEDIPNAPELSKWFKNSKIMGIEGALEKDMGGTKAAASTLLDANGKPFVTPGSAPRETMPYEAMKKLRTLVGNELSDGTMTSDVPRSKWKALYGALSQDLDEAAKSTGNQKAVQAANRANAFTRAGHDRIDMVLDKVIGKDQTPESIFKMATSGMQDGSTKIGAVMKSLSPAERDVVKSAFVRRMGIATAGNQGAEGDVFSTQTFLTNWNKVSPKAKNVLFSSEDGELRKGLDIIAKSAENIKEGSKVFSNPSGTSRAATSIGFLAGLGGAVATGNIPAVAGLIGGAAASHVTARMMSNPEFVGWLAKSSRLPQTSIPTAINLLSQKKLPPDVKQDVDNYLEAIKASGQQPATEGTK